MRIQHEHKGRCNYQQHRPYVLCIYRTLIQQKLLVKFSCELPTLYLILRDLLVCVIICHCDNRLPQQKSQQNKVQHQQKSRELHLLDILQGPWQEISIDIIGPLPKLNRMNAIVVIVDRFMKMIQLKVTATNISSEGIAKIYKNKVWKIHRVPRKSSVTENYNLH